MGNTIGSGGGGVGGGYDIPPEDDKKDAKGANGADGSQGADGAKSADAVKDAEKEAAAKAAAEAAAAKAAAEAAAAKDTVTTKSGNDSGGIDGVGSAKPGDGAQPIKNDSIADIPPGDASQVASAIIGEINDMYGKLEGALEAEYNKLIGDCKDRIEDLQRKIHDMKEQIEHLKKAAEKIRFVADKMEQFMDKIGPFLNHQSNAFTQCMGIDQAKQDQLTKILAQELKSVGVEMDPAMLGQLAKAMMTADSPVGPAMAMMFAAKIANLMFEQKFPDASAGANKAQEPDIAVDNDPAKKPGAPADPTKVDPTKVDAAKEGAETTTTPDALRQGAAPTDPAKPGDPPKAGDPAKDAKPTDPVSAAKPGDPAKGAAPSDPAAKSGEVLKDSERERPVIDSTSPEWVNGSAEQFKAELEALAVNAAIFNAFPAGSWGYEFQKDGSFKIVDVRKNAEAALLEAMFPGMGKGPNNYQVTKDFANAKKDGLQIQGFTIPSEAFKIATMMPNGPMMAGFLKAVIAQQATASLKDIDKAIAKLEKEIDAAKGEIKKLYAEIETLQKKKEEEKLKLSKNKEKALQEAQKTIEKMVKAEMEAQQKLLEALNNVVMDQLNQTMETIEGDLGQDKAQVSSMLGRR